MQLFTEGDAEKMLKPAPRQDKGPALKPPWVKVTGYADIMDVLQEINGKLDRILRTQKPLFRAVK